MKKILSLILAVCMIASVLAACNQPKGSGEGDKTSSDSTQKQEQTTANPVDTLTAEKSTDKYRNYYQVWIGSFHDTNDDGIGDLKGIVEKLDYINDGDPNSGDDLGADGIWLSPMMPSSTYHKYNVENYFEIDPQFGTLEDFDTLLAECHKRGIVVIIDLVINHAGAGHEYFQKACDELREGKEDGYARYFNFSKKQDSVYQHAVSGSDYYYQGDFWDQMPDWNLSFEGTREYFEEIAKFWLDKGVDGFRLDAVKYFEDSHTDGVEFLKWFYEMAQKYKSDVYMVGEDWDDAGNIYDMYESGIDSLFNFKFANSGGEFLVGSHGMVAETVEKLKKYDNNIKKHNANAINANFLTNHDMNRLYSMIDEADNKMAAALYMLAPGNAFTYYGEEIGIESDGSKDEYKRTAMIWDSENLPKINSTGIGYPSDTELGGVKQQLAQEHSLLNVYRNLIKIRMQNPEIARGDFDEVVDMDDPMVGAFVLKYGDSRVMIIHNGDEAAKELTIDAIKNPELRGWSIADEAASPATETPVLNGTALKLPARTSVVLKEN